MATERSDRLLTVAEVAERLRLHPITIRRHIKAGLIRAVRIGRAVRVREADLETFARREARLVVGTEELDRRRRLVDGILARRDAKEPIDTTELVREARGELEERAEQWAKRPTPTREERARLKKLFAEAQALRAKQPPLGMTTAEVVHLARTARDWLYVDDGDK